MEKLNNKGMTLVELIVSFALLMALILEMLTIIVSVRNATNERSFKKDMLEFKTTMTERISRDLIEYGYSSMGNCTLDTGETSSNTVCKTISFIDTEKESTELKINLVNKTIKYNNIVYDIPRQAFIEFKTNTNPIEIKVESNYLIVNIPYFEIDKDKDYGIKIIHPINLIQE